MRRAWHRLTRPCSKRVQAFRNQNFITFVVSFVASFVDSVLFPTKLTTRGSEAAVATLIAALGLASAAQAGLVVTQTSRQEGAVVTQPDALQSGNASVKWADVLLAFNDPGPDRPSTNETILFRNGEVWKGKIDKMANDSLQVTVSSGQRTVAADSLQAIDFMPNLPPVEGSERGVMYRMKGKPAPGALLWIDGQRVGLDSPLGAIALDRKDLKRYVFVDAAESKTAPAAGGDEIGLSDGSVLRGEVTPDNEGFLIKHAVLGVLRARPAAWQWVRRHPAPVTYLAEMPPTAVETFPLIRQNAPAPRVVPRCDAVPYAGRIEIWPKTTLRYALPGQAGGTVAFRGAVGLVPGSKGAARVRMSADGRSVFEQTLSPIAPSPVVISFEGAAGGALTLEVDFDKEVRLPCIVALDDAYVAMK